MKEQAAQSKWKAKLHEVIYEADTPMGKWFDLILLMVIILSVLLVMLESVKEFDARHHAILLALEWVITIFFTVEYIARIICIRKPVHYIFSFYGIIDFLATIPLYLSYLIAGSQVLLAVRALRLLRVFRILKLVQFIGEASQLKDAIKASRTKIAVFIYVVLIMSVILGTVMYLIESDQSGFTSIPRSIYWTIVTLTTVGYGDIAPQTTVGQLIATVVMILGYGIIAVPTGIVTVEFARQGSRKAAGTAAGVSLNTQSCHTCGSEGHRDDAGYCYNCGSSLK
ncbi:MAG TPA: ion transporter [Robiginitalea sp.]|nr:ion transporter [Robiginitalea sp.]